MSKVKLLLDVVSDLRSLADSVQAVAEVMIGNKHVLPEQEVPKPKTTVTLEQIRAILADKSRAGHTAEVRKLLQKYGAQKLSAIDPAKYEALIAEAEVLANG